MEHGDVEFIGTCFQDCENVIQLVTSLSASGNFR